MKLLRGLKHKLQENLSLSSKILLRRLYSRATRPLSRIEEHFAAAKLKAEAPAITPWKTRNHLGLVDALRKRYLSGNAEPGIRTSILIPVFNKVDFTFGCVQSLLLEIDLNTVEVIIVNNDSTDDTGEMLAQFKDFVRVITNEENRGFVDACNQGAAVAQGQYLVFLNNDTIVLPDWLKNLLHTIESDSSVGAVGSMLLYPDDRIQEAGAIVWKNGEPFHYGWGKSAEDRRFNFAREVDYCSAASLLIRKDVFNQLGGFDRRYAPAYFEDVDLCFGVRSIGYKVVYQPASRLIHYEGATAGTDTSASFKHYQLVNQRKFIEKWQEVLEREHFDEDLDLADEAANRKRGPNIIVFDDRVPQPDRDAGSARIVNILQSLSQLGRTVFVPMKPLPEFERLLWKDGIETANVVDYLRLIKKRNFRLAILSRTDVASALLHSIRRADTTVKVVFDMVDASFVRLDREFKITGQPERAKEARHFEELELKLARETHQVWCASTADKRVISRAVGEERIVVVPTIHSLKGRGKPFAKREGLLFIGHLSHRPNSDAIHYFVTEIFPLLKKSLPTICFRIIGSNPSAELQAYASESVKVLGYVPNIDPLFQSARIFVAPLRFGAGVNGKIGEALSYGLPVVTTPLAAEGLELSNGRDALIAQDPQEFADRVLEVYNNAALWQQLADSGYKHIENHFTPRVVGERIEAGVRKLGVLDKTQV